MELAYKFYFSMVDDRWFICIDQRLHLRSFHTEFFNSEFNYKYRYF